MKTKRTESKTTESKKALGMLGVNYCFVKYSEVEDLKQKLSDASLALSHTVKSLAGIKWMSLRPEAREELSAKLTDTLDTKHRTPLPSRDSEADAFGRDTDKTSKSIVSPLAGSASGQRKKLRKR